MADTDSMDRCLSEGETDRLEEIAVNRTDNVLNMQITIVNCMKQEWNIDYRKVSELLETYDLLSYIDICYEEYNSMGIKGILNDLKSYMNAMEGAG